MRIATVEDSLRKLRDVGLPITAILDVGVQHSTPPLMKVFPDKPHLLFEPIEDYFPHIRKNYSNFDYEIISAAVSDHDGETLMHSEKKNGGAEISHSWIVDHRTSSSRSVRNVTLDSYLSMSQNQGPYLLKIDVEGPDVPSSILRGAKQTLEHTSVVVIEMTVDRFTQRANILAAAGFDLWDVVALCYYGDCLWQADAIFVAHRYKLDIPSLSPIHQGPFRRELWQQG